MQLRNVGVNKHGRKFSNDEKILSLSLFKKSPAAYAHLSSLFILASRNVLQKYISLIPLETGINCAIIEQLSEVSKNLGTKEKQFFVCWDEIYLHPHLFYNKKRQSYRLLKILEHVGQVISPTMHWYLC